MTDENRNPKRGLHPRDRWLFTAAILTACAFAFIIATSPQCPSPMHLDLRHLDLKHPTDITQPNTHPNTNPPHQPYHHPHQTEASRH